MIAYKTLSSAQKALVWLVVWSVLLVVLLVVKLPSKRELTGGTSQKRDRKVVRARGKLCFYGSRSGLEENVMLRRSSAWLVACSVFVAAGSAWASPTHAYPECTLRPSDSDVTAAKGAFQAGTVSFNEADYDRALLYWEDAYRRDCTATLLLQHLGRAYEGAGNLEQAVIALRTFIERSPESTERAQVQRRIDVFEQKIAEDKRKAAANTPKPPSAGQPVAGVPSSQQGNGSAPPPNAPVETRKSFPWGPVALIAGGGVATAIGGLVFFKARSDISDVENSWVTIDGVRTQPCKDHGNRACPTNLASQGNDARKRATVGTVVGISGLAIAGAGVVWLVLDSKHSQSSALELERPALTPWFGQNSAGFAWQGSF